MSSGARERAGDDATDAMWTVKQFASDFADAILVRDRNNVFVRRDLEYAVARGVDDWSSGAHVLFSQFFEDFRAGRGLVAERLAADLFFEFSDQLSGEPVWICWKCLGEPDTRHLPVSRGGVFAR